MCGGGCACVCKYLRQRQHQRSLSHNWHHMLFTVTSKSQIFTKQQPLLLIFQSMHLKILINRVYVRKCACVEGEILGEGHWENRKKERNEIKENTNQDSWQCIGHMFLWRLTARWIAFIWRKGKYLKKINALIFMHLRKNKCLVSSV